MGEWAPVLWREVRPTFQDNQSSNMGLYLCKVQNKKEVRSYDEVPGFKIE